MTIDSLVFVFKVSYDDGRNETFLRVTCREDARNMAWNMAIARTEGLSHVSNIEFMFIEA